MDKDMIIMIALAIVAWLFWEKPKNEPPDGWRDRDW